MRAIQLDSSGIQFRDDAPEPFPRSGESLIAVQLAGICETDLQLAKGYMGFTGVPGHEFVGIAKTGPHAGKRVVGEINCYCQKCETCLAERQSHCPHRTVIGIDGHDGAFAEWVVIPNHILHLVPDNLADEEAVFVEPLAAAFEIPEQITVEKSDRVAILGDGRLGLFSAWVLSQYSGQVTVFGKHEHKLSRFDQRDIPTQRINSADLSEFPVNSFDVVIDCTGSTSGLPAAIQMVRPRGTVVMKTTVADQHCMSLASIVIDEINLIGSRCGPFSTAMNALASKAINLDGLITHEFRLDDAKTAFATAASAESFKVVLRP